MRTYNQFSKTSNFSRDNDEWRLFGGVLIKPRDEDWSGMFSVAYFVRDEVLFRKCV